jgi:hypothetical protein
MSTEAQPASGLCISEAIGNSRCRHADSRMCTDDELPGRVCNKSYRPAHTRYCSIRTSNGATGNRRSAPWSRAERSEVLAGEEGRVH